MRAARPDRTVAIANNIATIRSAIQRCEDMADRFERLLLEIQEARFSHDYTATVSRVTAELSALNFSPELMEEYAYESSRITTLQSSLSGHIDEKTRAERAAAVAQILDEYGVVQGGDIPVAGNKPIVPLEDDYAGLDARLQRLTLP